MNEIQINSFSSLILLRLFICESNDFSNILISKQHKFEIINVYMNEHYNQLFNCNK